MADAQTASICSTRRSNFGSSSSGACMENWSRGQFKSYPEDFEGIVNSVHIYRCETSQKRVVISNGIPDHDIESLPSSLNPCEINWVVELPLEPVIASSQREIPVRGMIAMAVNGVPTYGAQESSSTNAVEPTDDDGAVQGANYWYGHSNGSGVWHVHNTYMGFGPTASSTDLLGYSMDGFKIYGPLDGTKEDVDAVLDECNGVEVDGVYQYHVRTLDQVDGDADYCFDDANDSPVINWKYILGCYSGSIDDTEVFDSTTYVLDSDCVDDTSTSAPITPTPAPVASTPAPVDSTRSPVASTPAPVVTTLAPSSITLLACDDTLLRFKVEWNERTIMRDCTWIGNRATIQRCNIEGVSAACPDTCGTCSTCEDTTLRFKVEWNGRTIMRDCTW
eukprot:CAMPEP_0203692314 /NCGR_PEP_ID=MMETSP0091-20130426/4489_1 /ASSEMBLY_ACC=CAM_ASM_001089 /TAXON_ID=426623 /ORGANISM="Chaetoceros affinis, Strain CCMP159" /LENGTH=391 /DNA_ID=CAMNT_0050563083 /DNA_START=137 /DNA_END=1309 /DNA_ORIENTATION=+